MAYNSNERVTVRVSGCGCLVLLLVLAVVLGVFFGIIGAIAKAIAG